MQVLGKIKCRLLAASALKCLLLPLFVLAALSAQAVAYYSTGAPISSSPRVCGATGCYGITTGMNTSVGPMAVSAKVELPTALGGSVKLRYQLNGKALAGYRGGILLAADASLLSLNLAPSATIRTYLSTSATPDKVLDEMVVSASALGTQLLNGKGSPAQLELIATTEFDRVEVEFGSLLNLGSSVSVFYAYGVGPNQTAQITGLTSNSSTATPGQFMTGGDCSDKVTNPGNAVDNDQTNYATFSSLGALFCTARLTVGLNGTAPGTYKAGFVIGQGNNLLDVSILSSLKITAYKDGKALESGSGSSLLGLSVLPDNKSLVTFQATQQFDAVSIERTDVVAALDNLRLYYGVGVASTTPAQVISSFDNSAGHYQSFSNGTACVNCGVTSPDNAVTNPNSAATINGLLGVNNYTTLRLDLNGIGSAGNRAGMVIGSTTLLDLAALSRVTLITYDESNNVLETASGASLLKLNLLPDGRQTVSFNTTKNFRKVGIQIGGVASAANDTNVFYAFTDNSNGSLAIVAPPTGPLPVTLTSFAVRRQSGGAALSWTTASEINSARFVVERSGDPATGFRAIGEVAAAGNASTSHTYTLQDPEAASLPGTLYYHLRQLDLDGSAHVSATVVLAARPTPAAFALYPNPATAATRQVTLDGTVAAGYSVSLYTSMGQLLSTRVVSEATTQPLTVPTNGLAAGIYQVVLRDAAGQLLTTQRLLVASY